MAGVGVNDELGVGDVAGQQVRVHGGHQDVVVAVGNEGSLGDSGRPGELAHVGDAPVSDRFGVCVADGQRRDLVAVLAGQATWG